MSTNTSDPGIRRDLHSTALSLFTHEDGWLWFSIPHPEVGGWMAGVRGPPDLAEVCF